MPSHGLVHYNTSLASHSREDELPSAVKGLTHTLICDACACCVGVPVLLCLWLQLGPDLTRSHPSCAQGTVNNKVHRAAGKRFPVLLTALHLQPWWLLLLLCHGHRLETLDAPGVAK